MMYDEKRIMYNINIALQDYMEKYRNLTYLEHSLEEVNRAEQNKYEVCTYES